MNKDRVIPIIVSAILTFPAFANPFLPKNDLDTHLKQSIKNDNYINFTGEWHGECVYNYGHDKIKSDLKIANDSSFISINESIYYIGGISNYQRNKFSSEESFGAIQGWHTSFRWNEDKSILLMDEVDFNQVVDQSGNGNPLTIGATHSSMIMENNNLIIKTVRQFIDDPIKYETVCTHTKNKED